MNSAKQIIPGQANTAGISYGLVAVVMVLVMAFIMGLIKIYSPDLGFHLRSAQSILDNGKFIYTDTFSYGTGGHKYFDLQWLYQLLINFLYKRGEAVLVIANALFITGSLVLVWLRFLQYTAIDKKNIQLGLFAFMMAVFVQPLTFEIRPYVLSGILLNLVLFFLESYKKGNQKALFFLPVVMLLWVNIHSLAVLGIVTIGIYNTGIWFEKGKTDKMLLLYSALSFFAFFVNPYFFNGLFFSLSQFGIISGNSLFKEYLGELQSPFNIEEIKRQGTNYFISPLFIIHLSAVTSVFSIFRAIVQKHFTNALLLAAYLVLLYLAVRNYSIFILVSLPLFVKYLMAWIEHRRQKKLKQNIPQTGKNKNKKEQKIMPAQTGQRLYKRVSVAALIIAIFISITSITDGYQIFRQSPYRFGFSVDKDQLPVEATAFLNTKHIKGKLLNHLDFGGYLMAHYGEKVFIDGRMELFGEDFFKKYYESITVRNGLKNLLNEVDPDIIVFPYIKATYWWDYLVSKGKRSGYKAVYFDGLSVIYLKSSVYPEIAEVNENGILKTLDSTAIYRVKDAVENSKPKGVMILVNGLWQKQSFSIADQNKASYCFANGFDTAALNYSVSGIEKSTVHTPNIFVNLSTYYQSKKMYNEAQLCEDKAE